MIVPMQYKPFSETDVSHFLGGFLWHFYVGSSAWKLYVSPALPGPSERNDNGFKFIYVNKWILAALRAGRCARPFY